MARRKTDPQILLEAAALSAAHAEPVKRPRPKKLATKEEERAEVVADALNMWDAAEMVNAKAKHFVAVYSVMYARIYEVECMEMAVAAKRAAACRAVTKLIADRLSGPEECAEYMAWVFKREFVRTRSFAKQGKTNPWRLTWSQLFLPGRVLEDYTLSRLKTG